MKSKRVGPTGLNQPQYHIPVFRKQLSNIPEDLQTSQQLINPKLRPCIPMTSKKKQKLTNKSEITLQDRLKKIISTNKAHKSHHTSRKTKHQSFLAKQKSYGGTHFNHRKTLYQNSITPTQSRLVLPEFSQQLNNPRRNKSVLDKILMDQSVYAKGYFDQLKKLESRKQRVESRTQLIEDEASVDFEFPQIVTGQWKVKGFIKDDNILLKGRHKNGDTLVKKYEYEKVYAKLRKDYQSWVQLKFSFEN